MSNVTTAVAAVEFLRGDSDQSPDFSPVKHLWIWKWFSQPDGAGEDLQRRSEHPQIQVKSSPGASTKDWVKSTDVNAMF